MILTAEDVQKAIEAGKELGKNEVRTWMTTGQMGFSMKWDTTEIKDKNTTKLICST